MRVRAGIALRERERARLIRGNARKERYADQNEDEAEQM
jgi:hypothetical protein